MELKWKTCIRATITVVIMYALINYWSGFANFATGVLHSVMPLIIGCIMAYAVNILMSFYESIPQKLGWQGTKKKKSLKRPVCMILAYLSIVIIVVLIFRMIIPELIGCINILIDKMPHAIDSAVKWLETRVDINSLLQTDIGGLLNNNGFDIRETVVKSADFLLNGLGGAMGVATGIVSSIISGTVTFFVALIFSIYLLYGKEKLAGQFERLFRRYLPDRLTDKLFYVLGVLDTSFTSFITGQCIEAVILGTLCMLGMLILRLPYAVMTGCLIGFTALIPIAGAYIGATVGALMIFTVSPVQSVIFLIYLVILQQIEGNLIYPRVVGSSIGLPGIWVLAAVTVGGGIMGIAGMLIGVPLTSAIYRLLKNDINKN